MKKIALKVIMMVCGLLGAGIALADSPFMIVYKYQAYTQVPNPYRSELVFTPGSTALGTQFVTDAVSPYPNATLNDLGESLDFSKIRQACFGDNTNNWTCPASTPLNRWAHGEYTIFTLGNTPEGMVSATTGGNVYLLYQSDQHGLLTLWAKGGDGILPMNSIPAPWQATWESIPWSRTAEGNISFGTPMPSSVVFTAKEGRLVATFGSNVLGSKFSRTVSLGARELGVVWNGVVAGWNDPVKGSFSVDANGNAILTIVGLTPSDCGNISVPLSVDRPYLVLDKFDSIVGAGKGSQDICLDGK